jgi:DNA-binding response OmpR family regulator
MAQSGVNTGAKTRMTRALRVLVVEDEALLAMEMERLLAEAGWVVLGVALDFAGAMTIAEAGADFALVDLNLRDGRTGPATAAALFAQGVPSLFVTADPHQIPSDYAGALGVITKPFSPATLTGAVRFVTAWLSEGAAPGPPPFGVTLAPRPSLPPRRH